MIVIPAIDIIEGQCVRLEQGAYSRKKVYHSDPLEVAQQFEDHGITYLHLVDLEGAKANMVVNLGVLDRLRKGTGLQIDWGGGIKSRKDLELVFSHGAAQATVGSIAAEKPDLFHSWLDEFGSARLILGADLKDGMIATRGWQETSELHWRDFCQSHIDMGVSSIISTDIAKDGMLTGPSFDLYDEMISAFPSTKIIASGGISAMSDLDRLKEQGCYGAIVGKAIYEGKISMNQLEEFISQC